MPIPIIAFIIKMKRNLQPTQTSTATDHRLRILKTPSIYPQMLSLREGYHISPLPASIIKNNMIANTLTISYEGTSIYWGSKVDLKTLRTPLCYLIQLGQQTVEVYPENDQFQRDCCMEIEQPSDSPQSKNEIASLKPPVGYELNKNCIATFEVRKKVNRHKLAQVCALNNCELIAIQEWGRGYRFKVEIPHFTKYVFQVQEDEEEQKAEPETVFPLSWASHKKNKISSDIEISLINFLKDKHLAKKGKNLYTQNQESRQKMVEAVRSNIYSRKQGHFVSKKPNPNIIILTLQTNSAFQFNEQYGFKSGFELCRGSGVFAGTIRTAKDFELLYLQRKKESNFQLSSIKSTYHTTIQSIKYVLALQKQPNLMSSAILNQKLPLKIRQQLALYSICFRTFSSKFSFSRNKGKINVRNYFGRARKHHELPMRQTSLLKDCIEWIIQEETYPLQKPINKYYQYLWKRKNDELSLQLLKFGQLGEAEFVANIEDIYYRKSKKPPGLAQELSFISRNELGQLSEFHNKMMEVEENENDKARKISEEYSSYYWLVKVGMILWYQIEDMEGAYKAINRILLEKEEQKIGYEVQWQILVIFFRSLSDARKENLIGIEEIDKNISKSVSLKELIWQWFFAQNMHRHAKTKNSPPPTPAYRLFRYSLLKNLLNYIYTQSDSYHEIYTTSIELLSLDTFVEEPEKEKLIEELTRKIVRSLMSKDDKKVQEDSFNSLVEDIHIFPVYSLEMMIVVIFEYVHYLNMRDPGNNEKLIMILKMIIKTLQTCFSKKTSEKKQSRSKQEQSDKKYRRAIKSLNELIFLIFNSHLQLYNLSSSQYRSTLTIVKQLNSLYSKYQGPIFKCLTQQHQELAWSHEKYLFLFGLLIVIASKKEYIRVESKMVEDFLDLHNFVETSLMKQFILMTIKEKLVADKLEALDISFSCEFSEKKVVIDQFQTQKERLLEKAFNLFGKQYASKLRSVLM